MKTINLMKFGKLISAHEYWMDSKTGKVLYMDYYKPELQLHIDATCINYENDNATSYYIVNFNEPNLTKSIPLLSINQDLQYLLLIKNLKNESQITPRIYTYQTSKNRNGDMYTVKYNTGKRDIELSVSKEKAVVEFEGLGCIIYLTDDGVIGSERLETYQFSDNYYFNNSKYNSNINEIFSKNDCTVYFKNILHSVYDQCYPISCCPSIIQYKNGSVFRLDFEDTLGSVLRINDINNPGTILCRVEYMTDNSNNISEEIVSVFPNMYEIFDKDCIDKPYIYWAEQRIKIENGTTTVNKNIFKVQEDKLQSLFDLLEDTESIAIPLIRLYEPNPIIKLG